MPRVALAAVSRGLTLGESWAPTWMFITMGVVHIAVLALTFWLWGRSADEDDEQLDKLLSQQRKLKLEEIESRNGRHFEEEVDKLDRWAEDIKLTLERELKELDTEIRLARRDSKTKVVLAEKLEAQRRIKMLEERRNSKRRQLFDAQDEVDKKRTQLIEDIEMQLKTSSECETLFTIRWVLPMATNN